MARPRIIGRIIVFTVNFVLWCAGILFIVFGALALADQDIIVNLLSMIEGVQYVTAIYDVVGLLQGVAIFMIVLGSLLFLLGGNGCHGIVGKKEKSICVYGILLLGAILVEIALIIYASVYPGTSETSIQEDLQSSLASPFVPVTVNPTTGEITYSPEETADEAWQRLQFESKCCGAFNLTDFEPQTFTYTFGGNTYNSKVPLSCCTITDQTIDGSPANIAQTDYADCLNAAGPQGNSYSADGCWTTIDNMHWQFNLISIIISSCLIAFEILGAIFAMHLWKKLGDD